MSLPDVADARVAAAAATTPDELRQIRAQFLGKKSELGRALRELGKLDPEARRSRAQELQQIRESIEAVFAERDEAIRAAERAARLAREQVDVSLPGRRPPAGALHPLETTTRVVLSVLRQMGFSVVEGPEIEDGFHNFDALNFPPDHPAKDMQDTFFVAPPFQDERGEPLLLRTHTSPVQIRAMQAQQPPLRVAAPGKVYRCDADVTHSPMFHQIEGFWVDRNITFRDLKGVLVELLHAVFGADVPVRFRPSFFPFTEPSAEVDIGWGDGWLEVLGCGMIHPNVLSAVGIDPTQWQGFAFGLGVERFAMLRYGIPDIRTFYESDQRVLRQLRDPLLP